MLEGKLKNIILKSNFTRNYSECRKEYQTWRNNHTGWYERQIGER